MSRSRIAQFLAKVTTQARQFSKPSSSPLITVTPAFKQRALDLGIATGLIAGAFYYDKKRRVNHSQPIAFVLTLGSLLNLNYQATINAFKQLAEKENKPFQLTPALMQEFFQQDELFKSGQLTKREFRANVNAILGINPSDAEFDHAWNAMLGDLEILSKRIKALQILNMYSIILSNSNPIHKKELEPLVFGRVLFSYEQGCSGLQCYKKLVKDLNLNPEKTVFVTLDNEGKDPISVRNRKQTELIQKWAQQRGIEICHVTAKEDIIYAIDRRLVEKQIIFPPRVKR